MFTNKELQDLRMRGRPALMELYDRYAHQIFREAVTAYGDRKLAVRKVWDTFSRLYELMRSGEEDRLLFGVLSQAEKMKKEEDECIRLIRGSLENSIYGGVPDAGFETAHKGTRANGPSGDINMQASMPYQNMAGRMDMSLYGGRGEGGGVSWPLPDDEETEDANEGIGRDQKRKSDVKQKILMAVMIALIVFLAWIILGLILTLMGSGLISYIGFDVFMEFWNNIF